MTSTILVIEDEFPVLDTLSDILSSAGYVVITASNGEDGLKKAIDHLPDLILCDIYMPGLNGHQVLDRLKSNPNTDTIPFIFLSAKSEAKNVRKGMLQGADDYLTKPYTKAELLDTVGAQLDKRKRQTVQFQKEIKKAKYYDELTGLGKRNLLEEDLSGLKIQSLKINALIIIAFKQYQNLKSILSQSELKSLYLKLVERIKDSLDDTNKLYFLENAKFACIIRGESQKSILSTVWDIINNIKRPINLKNHSLYLSCSVGIAFNKKGSSKLISEAELALDFATEEGHNNYRVFKPAIKQKYSDTIKLQNDLHKALKNNELMLRYQPKVHLKGNIISGFEALLRWNSPKYGTVSPSKFIPLAESNDSIMDLGAWVINSTIKQLTEWDKAGLKIKPVAINISVKQFANMDFYQSVMNQLDAVDIENDYIEFELTESIFINKIEDTKEKLKLFKSSGIKLSMDDFGTGYSSLSYIKNFPLDKIKIDKIFIQDILRDKNASELTAGIISMSKKLGFTVIAEGVETEEQADFLRQHQCDEMQGFLFSKPLKAEDTKKFIL